MGRDVLIKNILSLKWKEYDGNPLIKPPFPSPVIADPSFLTPDSAPDGLWHLFAHSLIGIHHYTSSDGISWSRKKGIVSYMSLRPFVLREEGNYCLFYEKILGLHPFHSRIEMRESSDLETWSNPSVAIAPSLPWHFEGTSRGATGNPCIIRDGSLFKLYYSAGLVYLKDCRFSEPRHIGFASSGSIRGEWKTFENPVISPSPDDPYMNLGAGSMKVMRVKDGYVGFQNGIYWDVVRKHSGSAIRLLISRDGKDWESPSDNAIIRPDKGWKKSHVYALDVKFFEDKYYLYFNARNGWLMGKECIGLAFGGA